MSAFTSAMALDPVLLARFVDRWREGGEQPLGLNWLAWHLGSAPMGEARVAVLMKAAEQAGLVARVSPRGEQGAWAPTAATLSQYPAGEAQVLAEHGRGGFQAVPDDEARQWGEDDGQRPVPYPGRRPPLTDKHAPFRGYLPEET